MIFKSYRTSLFSLSLLLTACNQIDRKDFSGQWIVQKATFQNSNIKISSKSIKILFLPTGFEGKDIIDFNVGDSTANFPGISTIDVPCKWQLKDQKLIISFDQSEIGRYAFYSIDSVKVEATLNKDKALSRIYEFKHDSILRNINVTINELKIPASMYIGSYQVEKRGDEMILTSSTTRFELLNLDNIIKSHINDMFRNLKQ